MQKKISHYTKVITFFPNNNPAHIFFTSFRPKSKKRPPKESFFCIICLLCLQSTGICTLPSCAVLVNNIEGNLVTLSNLLDDNLATTLEVDAVNL